MHVVYWQDDLCCIAQAGLYLLRYGCKSEAQWTRSALKISRFAAAEPFIKIHYGMIFIKHEDPMFNERLKERFHCVISSLQVFDYRI